jgi:hypothetical protein
MKHVIRRHAKLCLVASIVACTCASLVLAQPIPRPGHKLVAGRWTKPLAQATWKDVLTIQQVGRQHRFDIEPTAQLAQLARGSRTVLIELEGSRYGWQFDMLSRVWNQDRTKAVNFGRLIAVSEESPVPALLEMRAVVIKPEETQLLAQRVETTGQLTNITLTQSLVACTFSVGREPLLDPDGNVVEPGYAMQLSAADLWALTRTNARRNIREFLAPALRQMGDRLILTPGPGDVYRAFDDIEPLADAKSQTQSLVADLKQPDASLRDRATGLLTTNATQTVPVLLRMDRQAQPDDIRLLLDRTIDQSTRYPNESPADLRSNRDFLIESLRFPDREVRQRAARILRSQFQIEAPVDPTDDEIDQLHLKD